MTTFTDIPVVPVTVDINKVTSYVPSLDENRQMVQFEFSGSWNCKPQVPFIEFKNAINAQREATWRAPHNVQVANAVWMEFKGTNNEFVTIGFYGWKVRLEVKAIQMWIDSFEV
jgi:hypothetical protein